jgi:hypothetical protein
MLLNGWGAPAVLHLDDDSGESRWLGEVAAALVADDGTLYVAGREGVLSVHRPPRDGTALVTEFRRPITFPTDDRDRVRGLTADRAGRGWVLLGSDMVPIRLADATVHPLADALQRIVRPKDGDDPPGAAPSYGRWIGAVAVVDGDELLISNSPSPPFRDGVGNGLLHRVRTDGGRELLAGRTIKPNDPVRRAADLPIGEEVPATEINLDLITTIQPLPGGGLLLVCPPPRSPVSLRPLETATFLLLRDGRISRLPVDDIVTGWTEPQIHTTVAADGRVLVNARIFDDTRHQAAFLLDPVTGHRTWVGRGIEINSSYGTTVLIADGTELLTLASPALFPDEHDRYSGMIRVVRHPLPSRT